MRPFRDLRGTATLLALMLVTFSITQTGFLSLDNLLNISVQVSLIGLIACGVTLTVLIGGLDLSVGSVAALAGVVFVRALDYGIVVAGSAALIVGTAVGLLNGLLIGKLRFNAIIVTLGAMAWAEGLALWVCEGYPLAGPSGDFEMLGGGFVLYIPLPIVFFVFSATLLHLVLTQSPFGRDIYAIGNNYELAVLCGLSVEIRTLAVYVLSSALAAFSGMILSSRLDTASPLVGQDVPLQSVIAVVLGGTRLSGGIGGIPNTVLGLLVVGVLGNGLNLWNIVPAVRWGITGTLLILFALLDGSRSRSRFVQDSL